MHNKSRSYDVWFLRYKVQRTRFFVVLGYFLPFDPPNNPKYQNFEKMKQTPGDIIILHMSTINPETWSTTDNFISFWTIFCPFTPTPPPPPPSLTTPRTKILKKWKKNLEASSFYTGAFSTWLLRYQLQLTDFFAILGHFFPFYHPPAKKKQCPKNENFKKMKKTPQYHYFTHVHQKPWL